MEIKGVNIFVRRGNKFLAVKRSKDDKIFGGMWALPGGKIEKGETTEKTAKRELLEETGLTLVSIEDKFCMKGRLHIEGYPSLLIFVHRGEASKEVPKSQDNDIEKVGWIGKASFIDSLRRNNYPPKEIKKLENFFTLEGLK